MTSHRPPLISSFISDYGMIIGLLLLCVFFSYVTWDEQHATGLGAANQLRENITKEFPPGSTVLIVARNHQEDVNFAESLAKQLKDFEMKVVGSIKGQPIDARKALERLAVSNTKLDVIACTDVTSQWTLFENLKDRFPSLENPKIFKPPTYMCQIF